MGTWSMSDMNKDQLEDEIRTQNILLRTLEHKQSQPGFELGTDARHELDLEILESFHLLSSLRKV